MLTPSALCGNVLDTYAWFVNFPCVEGELPVPHGTARLKDGIRSNLAFPRAETIIHTSRNTSEFEEENNNNFFSCAVGAMRTKPGGALWPCEALPFLGGRWMGNVGGEFYLLVKVVS